MLERCFPILFPKAIEMEFGQHENTNKQHLKGLPPFDVGRRVPKLRPHLQLIEQDGELDANPL
ncbi:hypothetical protein HW44_04635 [Nitrosococcus oceani]|nr:hypothetical protein HW44_04635 [Nitrosococcus oceani]